jgi:hypothetical protein
MPYDNELDLVAGAMGSSVWTWPWQVGIPTLQQITDALFPRPAIAFLPAWGQSVLDKWNWFADLFHTRLVELAGEEVEDEETFGILIVEAAEYAASEMGVDLWDAAEGLPSMPPYEDESTPTSGVG